MSTQMGMDIVDERHGVKMSVYSGTGGVCLMVYEGPNYDNPTKVHSKFWIEGPVQMDLIAAGLVIAADHRGWNDSCMNYFRVMRDWMKDFQSVQNP